MQNRFTCFFRVFSLGVLSTLPLCASQSEEQVRLTDHVPSQALSKATFVGRMADESVPLTFVLPLRNQDTLEEFILRVNDPQDELYGKYLTPEEFAERFSPSQNDYDQVVAYAESVGLTVTETHSNRLLLNVEGPLPMVENALQVRLNHYQEQGGRTFFAPDNDPKVPQSIASLIHGIIGLDNHVKLRPYLRQKPETEEASHLSEAMATTYPSGPKGGYSPNDLLIAYNLTDVQAKGTGQIIALFELGGYLQSDIDAYTQYFGLPAAKLKNIVVGRGFSNTPDPEVTLDIELALALAPESEIYVYEGPNTNQGSLNLYNRIATDNLAKQVSTSWGSGEKLMTPRALKAENAIFMQMASQGQTIYAAAGDSGAYDAFQETGQQTLMVDDPASQPYVVGVGGTSLTVDSMSGAYQSEMVWNDGLQGGAGGGGVSKIWPLPTWQSMLSSASSMSNRNVPDVSLHADPSLGHSIFFKGKWVTFGGTSCAAPLWAGFNACVNQMRVAAQKPVIGFITPILYALGKGASYVNNFHDIISGDNLYYHAGEGYDNASGWGSFNGTNLLNYLIDVN